MPLVKVRKANQITLPRKIGGQLGIKEGDCLDLRSDGQTVFLRKAASPEAEDEAWFLSPGWQSMEEEADRAIAEGRVSQVYDTAKEAIDALHGGPP